MKRLLLISLMGCLCLIANAYEPEIVLGTRQGCSMSFQWYYPSVNQEVKIGYLGGITSRFIFEKYFGLQVELNYRQCGWSVNMEKSPSFKYPQEYKLHYIELPFMTHLFFGKGMFRWFFNIGLEVGYMLNKDTPELVSYDIGYKFNRFDYGICGGTGFEFNTRAGIYQLEARYNFGLGDIFPNHSVNNYSRSSNQVIAINLGILFDINKNKYKRQ